MYISFWCSWLDFQGDKTKEAPPNKVKSHIFVILIPMSFDDMLDLINFKHTFAIYFWIQYFSLQTQPRIRMHLNYKIFQLTGSNPWTYTIFSEHNCSLKVELFWVKTNKKSQPFHEPPQSEKLDPHVNPNPLWISLHNGNKFPSGVGRRFWSDN